MRKASLFRWYRTVAVAFTALFFAYCAYGAWRSFSNPPGVDFVSFWAAGRLALSGNASAAYDVHLHRMMERTAGHVQDSLLPFVNPPQFLLVMAPISVLPFWFAFLVWVSLNAGVYYFAFRRIVPLPFTFAHPSALINALIGQNGMLTAAIFAWGTKLLETSPVLAGAILGTLIIKPQLALMLPVVVLATRNWRAALGAALSIAGLTVLALAAFGAAAYRDFFVIVPFQNQLAFGGTPWIGMATAYAACRFIGLPNGLSILVHALVASAAIYATWVAWSQKLATRIPILAAASVLIPPYLFHYDCLLLMIPLGWLIRKQHQPTMLAAIWLLSMLTIAGTWGIYPGPNTIPLAAALSIWAMFKEAREGADEPKSHPA